MEKADTDGNGREHGHGQGHMNAAHALTYASCVNRAVPCIREKGKGLLGELLIESWRVCDFKA